MKINTPREAMIEARNEIQRRISFAMADKLWWSAESGKLEDNTQDKVAAIASIKNADERIKKDTSYLKCFDELLALPAKKEKK